MKEEIIEFFRPDREKVILALFYPYVFLFFAIFIDPSLIGEMNLEYYGIVLAITLLLQSISTYPFICSLFSIYKFYKSKNLRGIFSQKTTLALMIIGITILNPLLINAILSFIIYFSYNYFYISTTPGVQIIEYSLEPTSVVLGLPFGVKIYGIEIYRNDTLIVDENVEDTYDFNRIVLKLQENDTIQFYGERQRIFSYTVENPLEFRELDVQNIGSKPLPMVKIVKISPDSPFSYTGLSKGSKIYKVESFNIERVKKGERSYGWNKTNISIFIIRNTNDFYQALNSANQANFLSVAVLFGQYETLRNTTNITDWGIEVKNVEIK